MIYQLHHQNIQTGETTFCAQQEVDDNLYHEAARSMEVFVEKTMKQYPLPDDPYVKWMICNQNSKYFTAELKENASSCDPQALPLG